MLGAGKVTGAAAAAGGAVDGAAAGVAEAVIFPGALFSVEAAGLPNPANIPPVGAGAGAGAEVAGAALDALLAGAVVFAAAKRPPGAGAEPVMLFDVLPNPVNGVAGLAAAAPSVAGLSLLSNLNPEKSDADAGCEAGAAVVGAVVVDEAAGAAPPNEKDAGAVEAAAGTAAELEAFSAGLLPPKEKPVPDAGAAVLAVLKLNPAGFVATAAAGAVAGAVLDVALVVAGPAPRVNPPVGALVVAGALLDGVANPVKVVEAGLLLSAGFDVLGCPNREPPPPAGAAGLPKPAKRLVGGAEAGVVLELAAAPVAAGVPNEKACFGAGVVEPAAGAPPPNRFPLPPLAKENVLPPDCGGAAAAPPNVCPDAPPNENPEAGDEEAGACWVLLAAAPPKLKPVGLGG